MDTGGIIQTVKMLILQTFAVVRAGT